MQKYSLNSYFCSKKLQTLLVYLWHAVLWMNWSTLKPIISLHHGMWMWKNHQPQDIPKLYCDTEAWNPRGWIWSMWAPWRAELYRIQGRVYWHIRSQEARPYLPKVLACPGTVSATCVPSSDWVYCFCTDKGQAKMLFETSGRMKDYILMAVVLLAWHGF